MKQYSAERDRRQTYEKYRPPTDITSELRKSRLLFSSAWASLKLREGTAYCKQTQGNGLGGYTH
jgi:hypothetical protein